MERDFSGLTVEEVFAWQSVARTARARVGLWVQHVFRRADALAAQVQGSTKVVHHFGILLVRLVADLFRNGFLRPERRG